MKPNIWLRKQPIPKLRSTLKHLTSWTDHELVSLALLHFGQTDLNNKQVQQLIKTLKDDQTKKPPLGDLDANIQWDTQLSFKLNRLKLGPKTEQYKSGKYIKTRFQTIQEAIAFSIDLIQDSKVCWDDAYKQYLETTRDVRDTSTTVPLPDNAEDYKKYWGLQLGDKLVSESKTYTVSSVKPTLDGPPIVTAHEDMEL